MLISERVAQLFESSAALVAGRRHRTSLHKMSALTDS